MKKNISLLFPQFKDTIPGCAICVIKDSTVVMRQCLGAANLKTKAPITENTAFRLASLTKPFTAMAIMLLKEQRFISFEDTIGKFFPQFPQYGKAVTIRQLLTHTSGIPDHEAPIYKMITKGEEPTIYNALEVLIKQNALLFPSGKKFLYSDAGYVLLALIIEKVTSQKYRDFLQETIFTPLKMKNTYVMDETKPIIPLRAIGYKRNGNPWLDYDYDQLNYIIGDEGIYSSIEDLIHWNKAWESNILVSEKTLSQAFIPQILIDGKKGECGFAWFVKTYEKRPIIFQDGCWVGFNNIMLKDKKTNTTIIFLSNTTNYPTEIDRLQIAMTILEFLQSL